ncbi:NAD(P)-dependent oxidoreductase [Fusobacterium russii]|uniref:NAD(P)-dependent oxidoreductase n=1 Tax=Fusobacterium russii TaxID=854 RepID=UPI00039F1C95|nr:NAD(P)-dependent oxidoreductase [Fusobacterium russii]
MEKNKIKIGFLDRNAVGPFELKEKFSKYGEYTELNLTNNDNITDYLKDYDVVILNRIRLGKKEFEKAPKLKLVLLTGTGYNHIDLVAAKEYGIIIANVENYSTNSVAQLTMTFLLNELTKVEKLSQEVKKNKWLEISNKMDRYYHVDTEDKVLGILGYGNIGKKVEKYAKSFGMEVMIAKIPGREYKDNLENRFPLEEVLQKCDILTIHAPLSDLTRNLINLDRMKKMKKSAIILNLGRGPIINEEDLYYALKNKIIASAATDVMTKEPPQDNYKLFELENLTITPHLAWKSLKSLERLFNEIENNLKLFLENKLIGLESK